MRKLNNEEVVIIPDLVKILLKSNREKPILCSQITTWLINNKDYYNLNYKPNSSHIRKLINFIRSESILPVMSFNRGYYVSYKTEDIENMVKSLRERAQAISAAADGLFHIEEQKFKPHNK